LRFIAERDILDELKKQKISEKPKKEQPMLAEKLAKKSEDQSYVTPLKESIQGQDFPQLFLSQKLE